MGDILRPLNDLGFKAQYTLWECRGGLCRMLSNKILIGAKKCSLECCVCPCDYVPNGLMCESFSFKQQSLLFIGGVT